MADLWSRLRRARLVQVLVVYVGASWAVLEVADVFIDKFGLPGWYFQAAILLLLIGLVILVTTGWVQTRAAPSEPADSTVPSPWEVDLLDLKESVSHGRLPHLTWARAVLGGVVAFLLLFGFGGLYVLLNPPTTAVEAVVPDPAAAAPGIAVLPFRTVGAEMELWREGMVDLLSTNLDGAAGLRTIAPRTVLSSWQQVAVDTSATVDLPTALQVTQRVGARYALLGSAVSLAGGVRLTAEVYAVDGQLQGRAQVEGQPDSVFALVDELSLEVLRAGLVSDPSELPAITLKGLTTSSLPALKAYLAGEQKFRRSRFREAIAEFQSAIEADSTFALALYRISQAYGWIESFSDRTAEYGERAARFADRLPEREALLLRGNHELDALSPDAVDEFEALTARYPDYVEAWQALGEAYWHVGEQQLYPRDRYRQAFRRALELDPGFGPTYIHLIDDALVRRDSAEAHELIVRHRETGPGSPHAIGIGLAWAMAWGDSAEFARARSALDTASSDALATVFSRFWWSGVHDWRGMQAVADEILEPRHPERARLLGFWAKTRASTVRGRIREARASAHQVARTLGAEIAERWAAQFDVQAHLVFYPDSAPTHAAAPDLAVDPWPLDRFLLGALAASEGRWTDVEEQIRALESPDPGDAADTLTGGRAFAEGLRGYMALYRGEYRDAVERLESVIGIESDPDFQGMARYELGKLWLELGEPEKAEPYFRTLELKSQGGWFLNVLADYYLGEVYERLGDGNQARLHYARFVRSWEDADPELQAWRDRAREALERLVREGSVTD